MVGTREYDKYENERSRLQSEVSKTVIKPISFEIFAKTPEEKIKLKNMKAEYKKFSY